MLMEEWGDIQCIIRRIYLEDLEVVVEDRSGQVVFVSGDLDDHGNLRNSHSLLVEEGLEEEDAGKLLDKLARTYPQNKADLQPFEVQLADRARTEWEKLRGEAAAMIITVGDFEKARQRLRDGASRLPA